MDSSLATEVANHIRREIESFPQVRPYENKFPIVENENVFIINEMHHTKKLRKMHLETGYTDSINVMHCVLYPNPDYPIPIFGADIVETPKMVTAAIVDMSPVYGSERYVDIFRDISYKYQFQEDRVLPPWSEDVFSEGCKFIRIKTDEEKRMFMDLVKESMKLYKGIVENAQYDMRWINTMKRIDDQAHYCNQQRKNKKTKAVLSKWFDPEWAENYINEVLFDKVKHDWSNPLVFQGG
jgi:phycocyanobilin:ferredoxin oxidoreductase|tara:strand:- start:6298 stop:7014 length:717 start_codon:yes stop_codon:yes gene_type:complete